jgi:uncharacterized protein YjbJ (UPF0337 family)
MSNSDKFSGKAKENVGKATGDEDLQKEGKRQHAKGEFEEKTEEAKDAAQGAFESTKDTVTPDER